MAKTGKPRSGSLQFWPRKRARKEIPRLRNLPISKENKALCFIGYKAGMTHIIKKDNRPNSMTKNESVSVPVTIIECPPLKIASSRFYKKTPSGLKLVSEVLNNQLDKELKRKIDLPKKAKSKTLKPEQYDLVRVLLYTQPKKAGFGKKKPEIVEASIGGNKEEQLKFIEENKGKEIRIGDLFKEGEFIDVHAVTKGKGYQGPVKRFGISLTDHKSEKSRRTPGSLGPWKAHAHIMWKIAFAGQTGYHTRTEYNKKIMKISEKPEEINPSSGIRRYGLLKSSFILIRGSIPGPKKRAIVFTPSIRVKKQKHEKPIIEKIIKK
jgi:large subunit ribosomal protein L3